MKVKNEGLEILSEGSAQVSSEITEYSKYNLLKRCDTLLNTGSKDIFINKCLCKFDITENIDGVLYNKSSWCNENIPVKTKDTKLHIESRGARTTDIYNPFIRLYTKSGIHSFHVLPIGDWEISINDCSLTAGLKSTGLNIKLAPGERLTLPEIIVHSHPGSDENLCNIEFQNYLNEYLLVSSQNIPIVYNSWFYDFDKFYVDDLKKQADAVAEIGAEVFIVDAGWYGPTDDDWSKAAGDWREKTNGAFYGKMKAFSDYVRSIGLKFGLWIEPEKICQGTPIFTEHPEWFIKADEGIYYPDLVKTEVHDYIYSLICGLIDKYTVCWLKIDFNFPLANDPHNSNYYLYMKSFYSIIDKLRITCPSTIFEACESGAMRADLESNKHFHTQFLSDTARPTEMIEIYKNALYRTTSSHLFKWIVLRQIHNVPRYSVPLSESGGALIVPTGPTWNTFESCHISTICNLVFLGNLGFSGDLSGLTVQNKTLLTMHINIYREYMKDLPSTSICLGTDEPGWSVFRIDNEKATIEVAFRDYGSSTKCKLPDNEIEMPETDYACFRLITKT